MKVPIGFQLSRQAHESPSVHLENIACGTEISFTCFRPGNTNFFVLIQTFQLNQEEHYHDMLNDSGQDGWSLKESMPLPKKLAKCMQDVDVLGMKIRHKVKFNIALHNPDGHISEVSIPIS